MADSVNTNNYSNYNNKTNASSTVNSSVNSWFEDKDKNDITVDSFLQLMIAQLKNQDFNNPVDDTQYVTQLAQFASMQQMKELAYFSKANYVHSLLGKEASAMKMSLGGSSSLVQGIISKISLVDGEFTVFIGEQMFKLNQIMEVKNPQEVKPEDPKEEEPDETEEVEEVK